MADSHTNNFRDNPNPNPNPNPDACIQCDLLTVDFPPENKVVSSENEVNSVHKHRDTRDHVTSNERGRSMKRTTKSSHCRNSSSSSCRSVSRDQGGQGQNIGQVNILFFILKHVQTGTGKSRMKNKVIVVRVRQVVLVVKRMDLVVHVEVNLVM